MLSTLPSRENDPHDAIDVAPDVVPAAWADKVLADIARGATAGNEDSNEAPTLQPPTDSISTRPSSAVTGAALWSFDAPTPDKPAAETPSLDTALHAADLRANADFAANRELGGGPRRERRTGGVVAGFLFALVVAGAGVAWAQYGAGARAAFANWTPWLVASSSPPAGPVAEQPPPPAPEAAAATATPLAPAGVPAPPPRVDSAAANSLPSGSAQTIQSMARDVAGLGQQIEQLRAGIAELRATQEQMARDMAKSTEAKAAEVKASAPLPRTRQAQPRMAAPRYAEPRMPLPPRPVPAAARQPAPAVSMAPYAPSPALPPAAPPYAAPAPQPQATFQAEDNGDPVMRPPMPVR